MSDPGGDSGMGRTAVNWTATNWPAATMPMGVPPVGMPPQGVPPTVFGPPRAQPGEPGWTIWPRRIWPSDAGAAAPVRVLAVAGAAAVVGSALWRPTVLSIGYLIAGILVFAAVYGTAGRRPTRAEYTGIALTLTLLAVPAVLAADWVGALCLAGAWVVGWNTLGGERGWVGLFAGPWLGWLAPARVAGWARRGLAAAPRPQRSASAVRIAVVGAITATLIGVFGALFAGADAAFAGLLGRLTPSLDVGSALSRTTVALIVAGFVLTGAYLIRFPARFDSAVRRPSPTVARWEWAVPLGALDALFVGFVGIQATVLFGGDRHVLDTAGLTYAEYARQGFWQLLTVSVLTLVVIAVTLLCAGRDAADRALIRGLLGVLCAMSVLVVASAVHRMWLYQQAYGFTDLRVLVVAVELFLGAVFVLIAAAGVAMSAGWLPRAVLTTGAAVLIGLAAINPDLLIARHNIDRYHRTDRLDTVYLSGLSVDALPALAGLPAESGVCVWGRAADAPAEPWYRFNLSRWRARHTTGVADCAHRR